MKAEEGCPTLHIPSKYDVYKLESFFNKGTPSINS